jgi:hypothetical protein
MKIVVAALILLTAPVASAEEPRAWLIGGTIGYSFPLVMNAGALVRFTPLDWLGVQATLGGIFGQTSGAMAASLGPTFHLGSRVHKWSSFVGATVAVPRLRVPFILSNDDIFPIGGRALTGYEFRHPSGFTLLLQAGVDVVGAVSTSCLFGCSRENVVDVVPVAQLTVGYFF